MTLGFRVPLAFLVSHLQGLIARFVLSLKHSGNVLNRARLPDALLMHQMTTKCTSDTLIHCKLPWEEESAPGPNLSRKF